MSKKYIKKLDVICMMGGDDVVIPLRIRIEDDDGVRQAYSIKDCRDISHRGTCTRPDGVFVTNEMLVFACKIDVFGALRPITLYYDTGKSRWTMSV
ncbi:MAG: hypothetical protein K6B14_11955 [Lachnospiraceae bacterium]|nr:hypothetical protein [Lachnospiraceae bacterium]